MLNVLYWAYLLMCNQCAKQDWYVDFDQNTIQSLCFTIFLSLFHWEWFSLVHRWNAGNDSYIWDASTVMLSHKHSLNSEIYMLKSTDILNFSSSVGACFRPKICLWERGSVRNPLPHKKPSDLKTTIIICSQVCGSAIWMRFSDVVLLLV